METIINMRSFLEEGVRVGVLRNSLLPSAVCRGELLVVAV